jgi:hypothetical protein
MEEKQIDKYKVGQNRLHYYVRLGFYLLAQGYVL